MTLSAQAYYSVSEVNSVIKDIINASFPYPVWICGEIQNFDRNRNKNHIFFELCEKDPLSKDVLARIGLVIFSGRKSAIDEILKNVENGFVLKDDIEVKFLCRVDFYPPHGAVRLIVESIDPVYTLGKIAQHRQKLIAELREKGTLDKNKQVSMSPVPLKIGLITAYDSAAYNDFIAQLKGSGIGFQIYHKSAAMQGKRTEIEICRAVEFFNNRNDLDAVVITRGGGSIAELSCFDSRKIAEKIAGSRLPVLSGIGHEINVTVTDLAAYRYEKTPTAIALFLIKRVEDYLTELDEKSGEIFQLAEDLIDRQKNLLRKAAVDLQTDTISFLKTHHQGLDRYNGILRKYPGQFLKNLTEKLMDRRQSLARSLKMNFQNEKNKLSACEKVIRVVHPINTLKRGFTLTRSKQGKIIKSALQLKQGDEMVTQFSDGDVLSQVHQRNRGQRPKGAVPC